jgi:putative tryptophan/tyrosine transport system substrate-binding protein
MKRREFIATLGSAVAWPLLVGAQQPAMPVIGFLRSTTAADSTKFVTSFRQGLKETGFVEGENVAIEYRYADNQLDRLSALVTDLVRLPAAVIVVNAPAALAAKGVTTTVPIVFVTGSDPVKDALVIWNPSSPHYRRALGATGQHGDHELASPNTPVPVHSAPTAQSVGLSPLHSP